MVPLLVASTVLSTVGALSSANSEANAAKFNSRVEDVQAKQANDQGAYRAGLEAKKTIQDVATQQAGSAQSGMESSGSVLDILHQTTSQGHLDAMTAIYNGDVNATSFRNDAMLSRKRANAATTAGYFKAGSTILNGAADIYGVNKGLSLRRGNQL